MEALPVRLSLKRVDLIFGVAVIVPRLDLGFTMHISSDALQIYCKRKNSCSHGSVNGKKIASESDNFSFETAIFQLHAYDTVCAGYSMCRIQYLPI